MARILSLVLAGSLLVASVAHCTPARGVDGAMESLTRRCRQENQLKPEEGGELRQMKSVETTDQRVRCYLKCVLVGLDLMNEEGDLTLDDLPENLKNHRNHFRPCRNVTGTDVCDKALNFHNCVWEQKTRRHS